MRHLILLPLLLLAACSDENRTAGGATPDEARALDDAAKMLESQHLPPGTVPSGPAPANPSPASAAPASSAPAKPAPAASKPPAPPPAKPAG